MGGEGWGADLECPVSRQRKQRHGDNLCDARGVDDTASFCEPRSGRLILRETG